MEERKKSENRERKCMTNQRGKVKKENSGEFSECKHGEEIVRESAIRNSNTFEFRPNCQF